MSGMLTRLVLTIGFLSAIALSPADARLGGFGAAMVMKDGVLYVGGPGDYPFFPMPASRPGSVHLFIPGEAGGDWVQIASVTAEGVQTGEGFGAALAVDGDWMVVGSPTRGEGGAAYLFHRVDGVWQESGMLGAEGAPGDERGAAVGVSGDFLLVGSPGRENETGSVEIFRLGIDGTFTLTGTIPTSTVGPGDRFGSAIAFESDRALVGAPGAFPSLLPGPPPDIRAGSVYLFESGAAGLTEVGAFAGQPGSMLGWSLAFRGEDALVGAPLAGQGTGLIVVYGLDPATGQWGAKETITPAQPLGPGFGFSIAVAGEELVVGAPLSGAEGNGVAYLFQQGPGGAWGQLGLFESETAMSFYGASVAGIDGAALIGAPGADVFEGMAQLVERETAVGGWTERGTITATGETMESITGDVVECTEGQAGAFGCTEVDLVAFLPVAALGGTRASVVNDVWGWTDPETSREYAIVGRNDGTAFVDLSAPGGPMYLGDLAPTAGSTVNMWRDIKVYANHAFIVADGVGAHGIQIFDLTTLRGEPSTSEPFPRAFTETAHYDGIFSAHNIVINEESGFAYVVGAGGGGEVCGGGLHMVDIRDPGAPTFAGCFSDPTTGSVGTGYSHDAMCVNYRGPDTQYVGRELCFGANETALSIADVTDKSNPVAVATASYPNVGYLHQGWISEDHRYFYMNDELDELSGLTPATRTLVWDIQELDDPILAKEHLGTTSASDHNLYVSGNLMYQSNYVSGLRILDISDPENPREVGFFDTVTEGENTPGFAGSWSNYPFFPSGMIAVTSMKEGLFIVRKRPRIS